MKTAFSFFCITLTIVLSSCTATSHKPGKKTTSELQGQNLVDQSKKSNLTLDNQWIIESFNNKSLTNISKSSQITIGKDLKTFTGNGACNRIGGGLTVKENTITFSDIRSTKMYCPEMPQEDLFLKNLGLTNQYKIVGGELFLYKSDSLLMTLESFR
jgi:heat shock protein HslJ